MIVGARGWHDGVRLWVEDEGPGVPPDEHEAVFEKFYRGQRTGGSAVGHGPRLGDRPRDRAQLTAAPSASRTWSLTGHGS